jgi:hypothetical protein
MTRKKSPTKQKSLHKKPLSVEDVMKSLKGVGDDVKKIAKLNSEEKLLVSELLATLKSVPQQMFSIAVSTSGLPVGVGGFTQARLDSAGHLILTSEDGTLQVMDLSETRNRKLMMAVVGDIVPKFKDFVSQMEPEKIPEPPQLQEITPPEPPEPIQQIPVHEEVRVELPEEVPAPQEEIPVELTPEVESVPEEVPVLLANEKPKLEDVVAETLEYLEMLGDEVFDQSPVSVYFDDWLVNLRQVMVAFESNEAVKVDDIFTDESERIYNDIEEELANRLLEEAELEASTKTLSEKKYVLREMDNEYAAHTNQIQVRGKSALDFLIRNVQRLEDEITKAQDVKTFNFIRRIALRQKRYILTQKLKAAKHRLSLAMQNSAMKQEKREELDSKSAAQTSDLNVNEDSSKEDLVENVRRLEKELAEAKQIKTSVLQPLQKLAKDQKISEITEKLSVAKELLELAMQTSVVEQQKIREEYEKKKQDTITKVQSLEKEIENKRTDSSIKVRKEAIKALADAVKALVQRQTEPPKDSA